MLVADLKLGLRVQIQAADDFYAYIDGWTGVFAGFQSGYPVVICARDDGTKTFLVPADQLEPFVSAFQHG
jgi:hypothetical protein